MDYEKLKLLPNVPAKVILIEAADELLTERTNAIPEEQRKGTHYTPEEMERRLQEYKDRNDESQGYQPVVAFFQKRGIEVLTLKAEQPEPKLQRQVQDFLEKVGQLRDLR